MTKNFLDEEDLGKHVLHSVIEKIKEKDMTIDDEKLKKNNYSIEKYIKKNEKKYIKKIVNKDWIIFEYEKHYEWFISNKSINIIEHLTFLFKENTSIELHLDNIKWSNHLNAKTEDFKQSKKIKYIIKK